jgi:hypothetical protein
MRPHSNDFHHFLFGQHLVNQSMLDVDAAGIGAGEVADQLFGKRKSDNVLLG